MPVEGYIQLSFYGKTSLERCSKILNMTILPYCDPSRAPKFQCLLLDAGPMQEWCEGDGAIWHGVSWTLSIGRGPRLARRERVFVVADFTGQRAAEILFKPRPMLQNFELCSAGGLPAAEDHRDASLDAGRKIPVILPFYGFKMRGAAANGNRGEFLRSFGKRTDVFPTLLASDQTAFAYYDEDNPAGGCIRYPTEAECERLMGLPPDWTRYGADGAEIRSASRYFALGNSVALPCAEYIMTGIAEALQK